MNTLNGSNTYIITYTRGSLVSTNGAITATEPAQWPDKPRKRSRYERVLYERLAEFGVDTSKLLARLRQEEATRKAASDHRSRATSAHPNTRGWKGRQLQTVQAAMAVRQGVRFGP